VQIIPFIANAFSIFLCYSYFQSIPKDLDEAARVDGAGWFRIYRSVIMPLAGPATATVAIRTEVDPVKAVDNTLKGKQFDEILVSTLPHARSRLVRHDLPAKLKKFGLPVTHVVSN
jgi:binding-protein-dependent transport system inner membrane component